MDQIREEVSFTKGRVIVRGQFDRTVRDYGKMEVENALERAASAITIGQ
jgi:hypothetical protein